VAKKNVIENLQDIEILREMDFGCWNMYGTVFHVLWLGYAGASVHRLGQ